MKAPALSISDRLLLADVSLSTHAMAETGAKWVHVQRDKVKNDLNDLWFGFMGYKTSKL
jgi:hypothetical protein